MALPFILAWIPILFARIKNHSIKFVASPGIEPGSGASETLILSIVLRGHDNYEG